MNFLESTEKEDFFERPEVKTIGLFLLIVGFVCFVFVKSDYNLQMKNSLEDYAREEINGIIKVKTKETQPRYNLYVVVNNKKYYLYSPILDVVSVGDSVSKIKNTEFTQVFKKDTVITIYNKDILDYYIEINRHN